MERLSTPVTDALGQDSSSLFSARSIAIYYDIWAEKQATDWYNHTGDGDINALTNQLLFDSPSHSLTHDCLNFQRPPLPIIIMSKDRSLRDASFALRTRSFWYLLVWTCQRRGEEMQLLLTALGAEKSVVVPWLSSVMVPAIILESSIFQPLQIFLCSDCSILIATLIHLMDWWQTTFRSEQKSWNLIKFPDE